MKIRAFITHKLAEHFSDCQDRFCINQDTKSVALADGMSQSYQQKIWANLIVDSYVSNREFVPNKESIKELSIQWQNSVSKYIEQLKANNAPEYLIIMNENALAMHKSAGATFLGIRFDGNKWEGDVLGDSCLIEIENAQIQRILTSQLGDEFDNHPDYFDSDAIKEGKGSPLQINGEITAQTSIILVSDPFSDFLNEKKKENNEEVYIKELLAVDSHEKFEDLVARWRNTYAMHNDDSTLIIIEYDGSNDFNFSNIDDIQSLITEEQKQHERIKQRKNEESEVEQSIAKNSNETINEPTHEPQKSVVEIVEEATEILITEDEFIKMFLDEYHCHLKSSNNHFRYKVTMRIGGNDVDKIIRKAAKSVYKKLNITKK